MSEHEGEMWGSHPQHHEEVVRIGREQAGKGYAADTTEEGNQAISRVLGQVREVAKATERVLVFPAELVGDIRGIIIDPVVVRDTLNRIIFSNQLSYMERQAAENNETVKQLIPYHVLKLAGKVYRYRRTKKGGDSRLHEKWSVGVGGHINSLDADYRSAASRELAEEVGLHGSYRSEPKALIYDDSDSVGRVHFGVVHLVELDRNHQIMDIKDPALADGGWEWITLFARHVKNYESWSQLVIEHLFPLLG